jgi:hypothetical protein
MNWLAGKRGRDAPFCSFVKRNILSGFGQLNTLFISLFYQDFIHGQRAHLKP